MFGRKTRRFLGLSLAVVMVLSLFVGAVKAQDDVLVISWEQEPNILAPMVDMTFASLLTNFYQRDVWDWDEAYNIYPVMIAEIPTLDNGLVTTNEAGNTVVTYKLREGLKWSDGEDITADDCLVGHRLFSDETTGTFTRGNYPEVVESAEKVDDLTVVLTYNTPWPDFQSDAFLQCGYADHIFTPVLDSAGTIDGMSFFQGEGVVGYGPYILESWTVGDNITFVANPNWDGATPGFSTVITKFIPDSNQAQNALSTGEVDVTFNWGAPLADSYRAIDGVEVWFTDSVYQDSVWMNVRAEGDQHPAMKDVNVRKAIVAAIDRRTNSDTLYAEGVEVPAAYDAARWRPDDLELISYDPAVANTLLDEAGWVDSNGDGTRDKDGLELILRFFTTPALPRPDYQLAIQQNLAEVGIGLQIYVVPGASTLFANFPARGILSNGDFDLAIFALSNDPLSPNIAVPNFTCGGIASAENPDGQNSPGFCNAEFDALVDPIRTTVDPEERLAYKHEAVRLMVDETFWAGIYKRVTWFAVNGNRVDASSVQGTIGTYTANYFNHVELWQPAG